MRSETSVVATFYNCNIEVVATSVVRCGVPTTKKCSASKDSNVVRGTEAFPCWKNDCANYLDSRTKKGERDRFIAHDASPINE